MGKKSPMRAFFEGVFGIIFFLILLGLVNLVANGVGNAVFSSIVGFFNANLLFLVLISVVMMIGAVFAALWFPFNLPHPVFNAIGGIMVVHFIFMLLEFIGGGFFESLRFLYPIALVLVPLLVLLVGYIVIFVRLFRLDEKCKKLEKKIKKRSEEDWEKIIEKKVKEGFEKLRGDVEEEKPKKRKKRKK